MLGTTEQVLYHSMLNTLKQNNLWLNSDEISAKRSDNVGFVENSNSDYTHHQETATKIEAAVIKLASEDPTAAVQFDMIKGDKFIRCTSKRIYGAKVVGEGIVIQTTNNNYGPVVRLLETILPNAISH